jgi:hypoxanthine phosphoribosyltransferase
MSGTRELTPPAGVVSAGGRPEGARVILTEEQIRSRVRELGTEISRDYQGRTPLLVSILKGGIFFLADLMRAMSVPHQVDFMAVSTYDQGTVSSGIVRILSDLTINIEGRDVLIVEDIVDTGLTLSYIRDMLLARHPTSLRICTLLVKDRPQSHPIPPLDYVGFHIPDQFVVGYGLDADEFYRHLPDLVILPETT